MTVPSHYKAKISIFFLLDKFQQFYHDNPNCNTETSTMIIQIVKKESRILGLSWDFNIKT
jgi:hypothetical protein